ncbi:hypothetical protein [Nocardioides pinisoli]|uniref:Uncharacterized protein n=1 Tax=Nocardioides pinisoli TaxID=2950279 RepID=A0ABT1KZT8_9ACTN|nr:hypothetical protein [Nocardioides pinisoli]MCP3423286.1 hypothetical protein [Nocardioides pinisoli]
MESAEARRLFREIERGEAASWLHFARRRRWQPLVFGVWAGMFVLSTALDGAARSLAALALIAAPLAYVARDRQRREVYPQGRMPRELRRSTWALVVLSPAVALLAFVVHVTAGTWLAAAATAVATVVAAEVYGRLYSADAEQVRRRLA